MNFQIDVKPAHGQNIHQANLYIDGYCYTMYVHSDAVMMMKHKGIIKNVKGHLREGDKTTEFDYPEGVDSAGVQFTSKEYQLKETNKKNK